MEGQSGHTVTINQSHGGSSKQAGAVIGGLEADVITMNQSPDIDILVERGGLVAADWRKQFPHEATPYTTTSVFLVRKGNPKNIKDWDDLTKPGYQVIVPEPENLRQWPLHLPRRLGYALDRTGSEAGAREFVGKLFANVPVLDGGGRGATTTFTQRDVGDVLVTFENEAILIARNWAAASSTSSPVAVDRCCRAGGRGAEGGCEAWHGEGRPGLPRFPVLAGRPEIIAKHDFRPRDAGVLKKHAAKFPSIRTFTVEQKLGGWAAVQKTHFADGGV